jgi:hypothetical protein
VPLSFFVLSTVNTKRWRRGAVEVWIIVAIEVWIVVAKLDR